MVTDITQGKNFQTSAIFLTDIFSYLLRIALCHHNSKPLPGEYYIYTSHSCEGELNRSIFLSNVLVCSATSLMWLPVVLLDGSVLLHLRT